MTLKQFLESEGTKLSRHQLSKFGAKVGAKAYETGIKMKKVEQTETFLVIDYPEEFLPKMQKLLKEHQFVLKTRKKLQNQK